jgi:Holliday junction resolvasome RuvABC endonuclease subunit
MAIKQAVATQRYANVYNKVHRYIRRFNPETATTEQAQVYKSLVSKSLNAPGLLATEHREFC